MRVSLSLVCVCGLVARCLILLSLHLQNPLAIPDLEIQGDHNSNHTHDMPAFISSASMALLLPHLRHSARQPHAFSPASSTKQVRCYGRLVPKGPKQGLARADPTPAVFFAPQTNSYTLPGTPGCSGARQASALLSLHTSRHERHPFAYTHGQPWAPALQKFHTARQFCQAFTRRTKKQYYRLLCSARSGHVQHRLRRYRWHSSDPPARRSPSHPTCSLERS